MKALSRKAFLIEIVEMFPMLERSIEEQRGLLSFEVDVIMQQIQQVINAQDLIKTKKVFAVLDRFYRLGEPNLRSLIRNAICEDLNFEDSKKHQRSFALAYLSEPLTQERKAWRRFMGEN